MMINVSNHISSKWGKLQLLTAESLAGPGVVDMGFPNIDPSMDKQAIIDLAREWSNKVLAESADCDTICVHVMGEMTFSWHLVAILKSKKIRTVASTGPRISRERADGTKESVFEFVSFREY